MKNFILLFFLLIGIANCSNSQNNVENEILNRVPESSAIFASFNSSTPAYKRYMKSPWFFDLSEKITKISENESFLNTMQPEERENFKNTINELTKSFKDSGFYPVNGGKPEIESAVFFLNLDGNNTSGGVYALGYEGVDLTKKVDIIKSKLSKNKLFRGNTIAGVNGLQLASTKNPILKDFSISAKKNKLALVSDEKLAEKFYTDNQTDTKRSILSNPIYQSIQKEYSKDDILNTFFIDVPSVLEKLRSLLSEVIQNNKNDNINSFNDFNNNNINNVNLKNINELIEFNPISSIVSVSTMPNEKNLHNKVLVSLKEKKHAILDVILEPVAEKNQTNIIKTLPQDVALFLNVDGSFLSKILRIIESNPNNQMLNIGIATNKHLITSIKSVTFTAKDNIKSPLITHPSFALILETSSGQDILEVIKVTTQLFGINWQNKELNNHQVDYIVLPNGITVCMSNDISGLHITTSEEFLSDIYSNGDKIYKVLPESTKKNINDKSLITTFVSFSKIGDVIENVISELKLYSLADDVLTKDALSDIKALNDYSSTLSLNKDSIEYEQDYFIEK